MASKHKKKLAAGVTPLYRVYLGREHGGYYKQESAWKAVTKDEADKLSHKEANLIEGKMRRLGYKGASMEKVED